MVWPYWVGHSSMTSANFGLAACLGLWLIASVQVDCVSLTAVLILDTSTVQKQINLCKYPPETASILKRDIFWSYLKDKEFV